MKATFRAPTPRVLKFCPWTSTVGALLSRKSVSGLVAGKAGGRVVFDLADPFAVSRNRETFLRLVRDHADIVFANGEEARILFDNYDPGECAKSLGNLCSTALVKDGARGSYVFSGGQLTHIPVRPVRAVDSTGAGDTYSAGFLLGLLRGLSHAESARLASHLAGKVIRKHGAQLSADDVAEVSPSDFREDSCFRDRAADT